MKGIGDLMKQAQAMQAKFEEAQAEAANLEITGESGAGMVRVRMNGRHEALGVEIDSSLLGDDKDMLEDLVAAAITDAARRVDAAQKEKMASFAQGLGLPPGMKLPF